MRRTSSAPCSRSRLTIPQRSSPRRRAGRRLVALAAAPQLRSLLRMALDDLEVLVAQPPVGEQDRVGEDELADVVEEPGRVDELLLALGEAERAGHLAR